MKFACERCGKKYATAETPAPGRVYKIKCKACGHLIVVKATAGGATTASTEMRAPTSVGMRAPDPVTTPTPRHPASTPDLHLEIGAPEPADPLPSSKGDSTQEISMTGISAASITAEQTPPADAGYVDLFADAPKEELPPQDDPFLAAARASLPAGYGAGAGAPDPFSPFAEDLSAPPAPAPQPPPAAGHAPTTTPKLPDIRKPPPQKSALPLILIGAGGLVLVGILAFVLLGGKTGAPPQPPVQRQPQAQAQAAAPVAPPQAQLPVPPAVAPPAPVVAAPVVAAPVAAAPVAAAPAGQADKSGKRADKRASDDDRRAREDRRQREREAKEVREREAREAKAARERETRETKERDKAAREAKARVERETKDRDRQRREAEKVAAANLPEAESGLGQNDIQKVLTSTRKAFESCILAAGKSGEVKLDGQRVMLRLNIQTNGAVTYPTLDDVTLNGTELGSCLKSAARLMVFPKFKGDTMHVEVPLVFAGR